MSKPTRTAVLFSGHFAHQARRGSMHWLADELVKNGWSVRFATFGFSWISVLSDDIRLRTRDRPQSGLHTVKQGLESYYHLTPFHPVDLRNPLLNRLAAPLFRIFPHFWSKAVRRLTADADLVVLESGLPILIAPLIRAASKARLVYRVNDDVRILRTPTSVQTAEIDYAPLFDRISLASPVLARRFGGLGAVGLDPMGLEIADFEKPSPPPFGARWEKEVVSAGTSHFDYDAVHTMAALRPTWRFHILGRLRKPIQGHNIVWYGETPFAEVVPYVQHANIGLAPYCDLPGVEYQVHHSNRLLQYAYLRLPTLGPVAMTHPDAPHLIGYVSGDTASIERALVAAERMDRSKLDIHVHGWDSLFAGITSVCDIK